MVGYKLSKNDWVTPFFVIFRSVREKLLVTVFFDHPVAHLRIDFRAFLILSWLVQSSDQVGWTVGAGDGYPAG